MWVGRGWCGGKAVQQEGRRQQAGRLRAPPTGPATTRAPPTCGHHRGPEQAQPPRRCALAQVAGQPRRRPRRVPHDVPERRHGRVGDGARRLVAGEQQRHVRPVHAVGEPPLHADVDLTSRAEGGRGQARRDGNGRCPPPPRRRRRRAAGGSWAAPAVFVSLRRSRTASARRSGGGGGAGSAPWRAANAERALKQDVGNVVRLATQRRSAARAQTMRKAIVAHGGARPVPREPRAERAQA